MTKEKRESERVKRELMRAKRLAAREASIDALSEIIDAWKSTWGGTRWSGTALQLHKALFLEPSLTEVMKGFSFVFLSFNLDLISRRRTDIQVDRSNQHAVYVIKRDT